MQKRHFNNNKKKTSNNFNRIRKVSSTRFKPILYPFGSGKPKLRRYFFPQNFREGLDEQSKNECEGLLTDVESLETLKNDGFK